MAGSPGERPERRPARRKSRRDRRARQPAPRRLRYQDVMAMVERLIAEERLAPGDLLPSRAELAAMAGVSLITVRRALVELEREGRVHSHQGVGTFVARPRIVSEPGRAGGLLGTLAEEHGAHEITTRVLGVTRGRPSATLAHALQLGSRDEVWRVRRLRVIDGRPMIAEEAVIPVALAPGLDARTAEVADSLYRLLARRYGLEDDYEEQFLEVVAPSADGAPAARARPRRPGRAAARRELRQAQPPLRLLPAGLPGLRDRLLDLGPDCPPRVPRHRPARLERRAARRRRLDRVRRARRAHALGPGHQAHSSPANRTSLKGGGQCLM